LTQKIEIASNNKRAYIFLVIMGFIFYTLFIYKHQILSYIIETNSLRVLLSASIVALLLGAFTFIILFKLLKRTSLILDQNGILDQSNILNIGLIEWKDITAIKTTQDLMNEIILIYVAEPVKYINNVNNQFAVKLLQKNQEYYGTCFVINPKLFKYDTRRLVNLIKNKFNQNYSRTNSYSQ